MIGLDACYRRPIACRGSARSASFHLFWFVLRLATALLLLRRECSAQGLSLWKIANSYRSLAMADSRTTAFGPGARRTGLAAGVRSRAWASTKNRVRAA